MPKLSPLDLVKRTPMTNCRQCGFPTCLAFGAAVVKTGVNPGLCPFIDLSGIDITTDISFIKDQKIKDLDFIASLKEKIRPLHFEEIAPHLGATFSADCNGRLIFHYLGQEVSLSKSTLTIDGQEPDDPRDQILLYNYIASGGNHLPAHDWVGMESLPNSISKIKTLATYCEDRLARLFHDQSAPHIMAGITAVGGTATDGEGATLAAIILVLPMIPQFVLYWEESLEDHFPAQVKVLFDRHVLSYLDLESLVFSSERLADRMTSLLKSQVLI